jgi:hypothetical protein
MATIRVPYLAWRDGRPRWIPGPRLRARGFKGRDLKDERGQWLGLEAAIDAARALNAEVEAFRAAAKARYRPRPPAGHPQSCDRLFLRYWESADFTMLKPRTQQDYKAKARLCLDLTLEDGSTLGDAPVAAVSKPVAFGIWEEIHRERGLHMANGIKAVMSAAFSYAELIGWRPEMSNPWMRMGRPAAPPRLAIWLPDQCQAFLTAADADPMTRSIGDAFVLGLHSAQRLGDVLEMRDRLFARDRIMLTQMKRGALIDVRMTEQVKARIAAIRSRRGAVVTLDQHVVINEETGRPYTPRQFNDRFRLVRARAAAALPHAATSHAWSGPRVYATSELRFQDLRDTGVTRLAMADNDAAHIAAVTGHSLVSITAIMKHYLALSRAMADAATDRLEAWLKREGIAV